MLIAEDLLLLTTDSATGRTRNRSGQLDYALAGALLSDLEMAGQIRLTTVKSAEHRKNRVVVVDSTPSDDPLLEAAMTALRTRDRTPASAIRLLKKGLRKKLLQRLTERAILTDYRRQLLGLFSTTRYPTINSRPAAEARAAIHHQLVGGGDADPRTSALIASLGAAGALRDVVPESHPMWTRREIRVQSRAYVDGHWPAKAARAAYQEDASAA